MGERAIVWEGLDAWRAEVSVVRLEADRVRATGTQLGVDPVPYRLQYELETGANWETQRLRLRSTGAGWSRSIDLRHDGAGGWTCDADETGEAPFSEPGGDVAAVRGAIDCDLGGSPLTNLMPVRRHALHVHEGEHDLLMAWVDVPSLRLLPSWQRYEHRSRDEEGSVVRFSTRDHGGFSADLALDRDGLVRRYPGLAARVAD
jgi:hypothetical protein